MKKYIDNREQIQKGDIILFRGDAFISRGIRWLDNAPYNHAGLVFEACGRKFVLESTGLYASPHFEVLFDDYKTPEMDYRVRGMEPL